MRTKQPPKLSLAPNVVALNDYRDPKRSEIEREIDALRTDATRKGYKGFLMGGTECAGRIRKRDSRDVSIRSGKRNHSRLVHP
jgi:hypothetical protein